MSGGGSFRSAPWQTGRILNMKITINVVKKIIFLPLFGLLILVTLLMISQKIPLGGYSSYVVLSGSMNPSFNAGDMIVTKKISAISIKEKDVATFVDPFVAGKIITHRIIKIEEKNKQNFITTQGDANNTPDKWSIPAAAVIGIVVFSIPKLGHLVVFAKQPLGFFLLILLPGLIIIASELVSLAKYVRSLEAKVKQNDDIQH